MQYRRDQLHLCACLAEGRRLNIGSKGVTATGSTQSILSCEKAASRQRPRFGTDLRAMRWFKTSLRVLSMGCRCR
jgi:hypothetical protein